MQFGIWEYSTSFIANKFFICKHFKVLLKYRRHLYFCLLYERAIELWKFLIVGITIKVWSDSENIFSGYIGRM
jgi:hypothetical protein